jgi:serine/threonine protein kinase
LLQALHRATFLQHLRPEHIIRRDLLPLVQQALGDRYTIEREVARGGAGRVFLASDVAGRHVALKILHPELAVSVTADRFLREIGLLSRLDHPLITRLLDYGEHNWLVYYAMSFAEGPTLRQHLDRVRRASIDDVLRIARDLLSALGYAHDRGIMHRDVKPDNVILSPEGAMLLDFGIARAIEAAGTERLTKSGFTVGTSSYMSPEQVGALDSLDHRSDLYSLGCVLYECLAGHPPFAHRNEAIVLQMQLTAPSPDVRDVRPETPEMLANTLRKALEKDPAARWQRADEMKAALSESGINAGE